MTRRLTVLTLAALLCVAAAAPSKKEAADLLVVNAHLVTMDVGFSVLNPGGMAVRAGRILSVGPSADVAKRYSSRSVYDAAGKIVLPGLVNTHTHAAMTLLRGLADDLPLDRWLTAHLPGRGKERFARIRL